MAQRRARKPPTLCQTFERLSRWVWSTLRKARTKYYRIGEESITDFLLFDLVQRHHCEVEVDKFTRPRERKTGADWLWRFEGGRHPYNMLVQAKRLFPDGRNNEYRGLKYRPGLRQAIRLIRTARKLGIDPAYCLYNNWETGTYEWKANWACCMTARRPEVLGVTIANAWCVLDRIRLGRVEVQDVGPTSLPLRCLVCCPGPASETPSLASRVRKTMKRLRPEAAEERERQRRPSGEVSDMAGMLRGSYVRAMDADMMLMRFTNIAGVVIIRGPWTDAD